MYLACWDGRIGLITLNVNSLTQHGNPTVERILHRHHNLFQGTGNLKGVEVMLQIDKSIIPCGPGPMAYPTPPQEKGERQTTRNARKRYYRKS